MKARPKGPPVDASNIMADAMPESARSNSAVQKTSHKCCAVALCTNRSDNRKDVTFHAFQKSSSTYDGMASENETI